MSTPLSQHDILFPHLSNTPSFSSTLSSLRRSTLSLHNRLASITSDSAFVASVASAYGLALVANERCGSWYIPPNQKAGSVYFKSTDGHMGEWGFSLRRLNLQLLDVVRAYGGAVVVDSTRRGKSMPDALSKTVPIWCCVMNRVVFRSAGEEGLGMFTPPQAVSESERSQIEARIGGFVAQFLDICKPHIEEMREKMKKPLRPIWVTQQSSLPESPPEFADFHPIVLCTASRRVHGAEVSEGGYIQGAADDHEAWSHGLTPPVFWKNKDVLLRTSEEDAPGLIAKLLAAEEGISSLSCGATLIKPTSTVYISPTNDNMDPKGYDVVISCTPNPIPTDMLKSARVKHYLHLKCQTGKLGSRDLRNALSQLPSFVSCLPSPTPGKILICCPTGKDLSVGAALAVLCLYATDDGAINLAAARKSGQMDKTLIKRRLSWITTSNPALNPSRSTLQSVNAALLTTWDPKGKVMAIDQTDTIQPSPSRPPLPATLFSNLLTPSTPWAFTRRLTSASPTHPSGTVTGSAQFTAYSVPPDVPRTLLYVEEGEFVTESGLKMGVRRKYIYQLVEAGGEDEHIVVKFVDEEKYSRGEGEGIGGVFVEMGPLVLPSGSSVSTDGRDGTIIAANRERHLCGEDLYGASWEFSEGMWRDTGGDEDRGVREKWWEVRYEVRGPKKDYVSVTRYSMAG
ncbi:initiator tRNA phosphoribosyl transferase-domain-containing protein [Phaeosphaeria sp. MPI-PUGE-AT-0046c]|nr:initiator tRNA phosphoribosyl transferase-domain-containing protein [Phaeosphaeria sp. MPI-PUGE-AT-0046c]